MKPALTLEAPMTDVERAAYWQGAYERMAARNIELAGALRAAADALDGLSYIHDRNPSDAMADTPPLEYARHMLFEARQMAKAAHSDARTALSEAVQP